MRMPLDLLFHLGETSKGLAKQHVLSLGEISRNMPRLVGYSSVDGVMKRTVCQELVDGTCECRFHPFGHASRRGHVLDLALQCSQQEPISVAHYLPDMVRRLSRYSPRVVDN
eukprot:6117009-Amphidinium_carterae.1